LCVVNFLVCPATAAKHAQAVRAPQHLPGSKKIRVSNGTARLGVQSRGALGSDGMMMMTGLLGP
jgi:hypothetical protein